MANERLFKNAVIHSLERESERFSAMRVDSSGRITGLYPAGTPLPPVADTVDLGGGTVVPAFIDSHAHFMSKAAFEALGVNLARLEDGRVVPESFEGVRSLLVERAETRGGPVIGFGLALGAIAEKRLPRASELDSWLPGRQVVIFSMDGHSSSYSSAALARLGFGQLAEDGILTGEAHEFNMGKVSAFAMRGLGAGALARGLSSVVNEAIDGGLVSIHCLEGTEDAASDPVVAAFAMIGGKLGLRLKLWMQYTDLAKAQRHVGGLERKRVGGCMAWEMDGSVSSRTAAFDHDYLDTGTSGRLYRTPQEALALVSPFYRAGWQTSAHAIGPRGIESILSAYEQLMASAGDIENRLRLRIDHFEFPRPDQIERTGRNKMVLTVQPGFAWADHRYIHSYERALADELRARQCPLRSLADAGCVLSLSTDAPVQPLNPFLQIAGAVDHPVPSERLTVYEALRAYSWAGAWSAFEEHERGTLAVGKYADFALLDADPFVLPAVRLPDIRALGTWHEGRRLSYLPPGIAGFASRILTTRRRPT
jgi:predicted amidohydrolase YtcJ